MPALAILGTGTGVGKTAITLALAEGLRALGARVWIHKPVACGGWDGRRAEDARRLGAALGDGQPEGSLCPRQHAEACSPHLAAAAAGMAAPTLAELRAALPHPPDAATWLLVEGAGGVATPLTVDRRDQVDLVVALRLPVLLVTHRGLGTLSSTVTAAWYCRTRGAAILGLVANDAQPMDEAERAVRTAESELAGLTGLPVLAGCRHRRIAALPLAAAVRARLLAGPP